MLYVHISQCVDKLLVSEVNADVRNCFFTFPQSLSRPKNTKYPRLTLEKSGAILICSPT